MKEIRFNANQSNSNKLRKLQKDYTDKHKPAKVSLDSLANLSIELGVDAARGKLNLEAK